MPPRQRMSLVTVAAFLRSAARGVVRDVPNCEDWCSKWTCGLIACSLCGLEHGCGRWSEASIHIKRCSAWCTDMTCNELDCSECTAEDGCPRPPSPPDPPPHPSPPPIPPLPPPPPCTQSIVGMSCIESRCCEEPSQTCFRKRGARGSPYGYAVCLTTCPEDPEWDCEVLVRPESIASDNAQPPQTPPDSTPLPPCPPPSPPCSARYETCWLTHCCNSPLDGCYRRRGKQFAMCKPLPSGGVAFCEDAHDAAWQCPGWQFPPPNPPMTPPGKPRIPPSILTPPPPTPTRREQPPSASPRPNSQPLLQLQPSLPRLPDDAHLIHSSLEDDDRGGQTVPHSVRKLSWLVQLLSFLALAVCSASVTVISYSTLRARSSRAMHSTIAGAARWKFPPGVTAPRPIRVAARETLRISVRVARSALPNPGTTFGQRRAERAKYTRKMDQEMGQAEPTEMEITNQGKNAAQ